MFNEPQLQQVHRLQMFTEIFRLQKTTDDVLIQQNIPNNSGGCLGWLEADESASLFFRERECQSHKNKKSRTF